MRYQSSGGSIVFVGSVAGQKVLYPQSQVSYNVSKAGILQLTRSLAAEWARYGIRVNSISPGYMRTIRNEAGSLAHIMESWNERNPMGRLGEPDELSGAVILLCSRIAGRYMTGEDIVIDGMECPTLSGNKFTHLLTAVGASIVVLGFVVLLG